MSVRQLITYSFTADAVAEALIAHFKLQKPGNNAPAFFFFSGDASEQCDGDVYTLTIPTGEIRDDGTFVPFSADMLGETHEDDKSV